MNVGFDPWIPVVSLEGERELISLNQVFGEGEKYADLAVRPHERVSLMRLFMCIAYAALDGPKDYDEWCEVPKRLPKAASDYLQKWKDSFELFHPEKPWLQVAELNVVPKGKGNESDEEKEWTSLAKLSFTRASGNNSTLFDHESNGGEERQWGDHEIALALLAFQNFFVAGGKASSRLWGKSEMKDPSNPKGGPCSGKSILFSFIRGNNLASTVHLNLNSYEDLKFIYGTSDSWLGMPLWERPIDGPQDVDSINNATRTHLGRLVPQTRMLRLHRGKTKILLGPGFEYPKFQDENNTFNPDVFSTIVVGQDGNRALLSARPNRSVWRELHSLIVRQKDSNNKSRGALCLLNLNESVSCDIVANAMITNPQQAAELVYLIESVFHIPSNLFSKAGAASYEREVMWAEVLAQRLGWAVEGYRKEIDGGWEGRLKGAGPKSGELKVKLRSIATNNYWTTVEKNLPLLMAHIEAIGSENAMPTREIWRKMLFRAALDAYSTACGETPRQMRAFAKGWLILTNKKNKSESVIKNKEEVNV